ncbi:amino acid ABC transporter membrane protein 2 (PAAT family) [Muricomes intestini]|jgi:polar amino acid transport system permease protein|uniref:Amino acid ABC transporter membrane protein 2 (PAAT family) n=1 Tax=Muricomes intestini TaxID=1796634 RepID=A0A4R3KD32_9FIRM|nr:ectoine/hydroxyectoine ABC transporter permease subunit EhuD [Muricomes intestini]TCS81146.1 amino acid ABC transporter membrane protein 2 (PAAT family) [Muricomes intestini]
MWNWDYAFSILPQILSALKITISATFVGFILALFLGLIFSVLVRSDIKIVSLAVKGIIQFIRNTPLLVQLYFIFYVFPKIGISLKPFTAGVLGLGIHYSTYLSEVFRSGIEAVPAGQWEVAKALNFSHIQAWIKIILPQVIPPIIPVIGNYLITMFKETPLLSAITLVEILQTAKILGAGSFRYLEGFTIVGIIFFLLSYPSSQLIKKLEVRLGAKN